MSARHNFVQLALEQLGKPVLWGGHGPDFFDCSGFVNWCLKSVGGKDMTKTHNAPALASITPPLSGAIALPGDLIFFGESPASIDHVAIVVDGGKAVSADGATSHILDLKTAMANPHNRVRLHDRYDFRADLAFHVLHRNIFVDAVDVICL